MSVYMGKVRLFVHKIDDDEYEVGGQCAMFDDDLISDVDDNQQSNILETELLNGGWDIFEDDLRDVIENYQIGDVVEIVADTRLCYWGYWGYWDNDNKEVDLEASLVNVKHRRLTQEQVIRFAPDLVSGDDMV